ncbi:ABC transporter permease protein [Bacillus thuringiensis serovar israelensis ATCC 35646]|nr:ABC transporter permease protein [Bacillus thuringiensis serovar israelensis ATCC 35646]
MSDCGFMLIVLFVMFTIVNYIFIKMFKIRC